jgi:NAD+ diphosphatase
MLLPENFEPLICAPADAAGEAFWFLFDQRALLVSTGDEPPAVPVGAEPPVACGQRRFVGLLAGKPCWAARVESVQAPEGWAFEGLRGLFNRLHDDLLAVAGRAIQLLEFQRTHRYCGVCATETVDHDEGRGRCCPACGETVYPRIAPAMMVLIKRDGPRGRELLLAHGSRFPTVFYSALAGFVEASESLEDCVHRETMEEIGVKIANLRYFASQSWPFPHSLMIAFVADYVSGEIVCQPGEIEDARWFSLDALPDLPHRLSIARRLINATIAEVAPNHPALEETALRAMQGSLTSA